MCIEFPATSGALLDAIPSHDSNYFPNFSDSRGWDRFPSPCRGRLWSRLDEIPRAKSSDGDTGLLELFLLFDAVFNWRWNLHRFLVKTAMEQAVYDERTLPQEVLTALLASATLVAASVAIRHFWNRPGACLAICGGLISAEFWATEVISLHAIDLILERMVGPMLIIASVWIGSSVLIMLGVLWDAKAFLRRNTEHMEFDARYLKSHR